MSIEEKVKQYLHVIPAVAEKTIIALKKSGIVEDDRLDKILPSLAGALQISKNEDGVFITRLVAAGGKILMKDDVPFTVDDYIQDYVFPEDGDNDDSSTISYEASLNPTPEQVKGIADGTLKVLPKKREAVDKDALSSDELREQSRTGKVSVENVASGKTKVDISK